MDWNCARVDQRFTARAEGTPFAMPGERLHSCACGKFCNGPDIATATGQTGAQAATLHDECLSIRNGDSESGPPPFCLTQRYPSCGREQPFALDELAWRNLFARGCRLRSRRKTCAKRESKVRARPCSATAAFVRAPNFVRHNQDSNLMAQTRENTLDGIMMRSTHRCPFAVEQVDGPTPLAT